MSDVVASKSPVVNNDEQLNTGYNYSSSSTYSPPLVVVIIIRMNASLINNKKTHFHYAADCNYTMPVNHAMTAAIAGHPPSYHAQPSVKTSFHHVAPWPGYLWAKRCTASEKTSATVSVA